jgi:hypothetical protein
MRRTIRLYSTTPFKKSELARMNIDRKLKTLRKQIDE